MYGADRRLMHAHILDCYLLTLFGSFMQRTTAQNYTIVIDALWSSNMADGRYYVISITQLQRVYIRTVVFMSDTSQPPLGTACIV